jgi:diguanylate cyclase (GGDEF)-like protein
MVAERYPPSPWPLPDGPNTLGSRRRMDWATGIVAVSAAALGCAVALLVFRALRARGERRFEAVLVRVDGHMEAISATLTDAIDRLVQLRAERARAVKPTLSFDDLLDALVAESAARTGAQAVALRVEGPAGTPVVALYGSGAGTLPQTTVAPPDERPFRAATIDWTYGPLEESTTGGYRSALLVPVIEDGETTGTIVVYSIAPGAFQPEHARTLRELVDETAPSLSTARRFAELERQALSDPDTGIRNRRGYELELEREIARARRSGRPLSLVLVAVDGEAPDESSDERSEALAQLLSRVTRATDILCRRGESEFAIVLPETRGPGADRFTARLRDEAAKALGHTERPTYTVGLAEWRADESFEALDARASAALGRTTAGLAQAPEEEAGSPRSRRERLRAAPITRGPVAPELVERDDVLEALGRNVDEARETDRPLALLVVDIDGFGRMSTGLGREGGDAILATVGRRLEDAAGKGAVTRIGPDEFAVVLSESTVGDAEILLGTVQASLHVDHALRPARVTLSAGITGLAEDDDARNILGRAEQALWQAKQAGSGTVVVAMTNLGASS